MDKDKERRERQESEERGRSKTGWQASQRDAKATN